ncbi:MAG: phosphate ABC transporter ATP-binding protein [Syntrophomonadaceae bacterium]|jgi:phosphate transport system ATP-binding protein|nr:phosphate ABC transporter ATP-binding protein [Syntrophomonadaceae bacterium]
MNIDFVNVSARYGDKQVLYNVSLSIPYRSVYALIGPSGCGKTTLLRSINRLNDLIPGFALSGEIIIRGEPVYAMKNKRQIQNLRLKTGMIFQRPNPLPMSVMQNMIFPYMEHIHASLPEARRLAEEKLRVVGLYDEIKDRLNKPAYMLSGGQQQRLCIARSLMLPTDILLMDEPCSALDPISTFKIEDLLSGIKKNHTIIMVTHNTEQARRISDYTAFFYMGRLIEAGSTLQIFSAPKQELTQKYITGRM